MREQRLGEPRDGRERCDAGTLPAMERLWAPWRLAYVKDASENDPACVFCAKQEAADREALVVHRGET